MSVFSRAAFSVSEYIITGGYITGTFKRVRDIINSNIKGMLDRAEDPEKLICLMIQEMEDALVEIKTSCARGLANTKKVQQALDEDKKPADT